MKTFAHLVAILACLNLEQVCAQVRPPTETTEQEKENQKVLEERAKRLSAMDEQYEENWRIVADDLQRELSEICGRLLPAMGTSLEDVLKRYGQPKEIYVPNSFKIRKFEFAFDTPGQDRSTFPMTLVVIFVQDKVSDAFFTDPNVRLNTRISSRGIESYPSTQQNRFNLLYRTVEDLRRAEKFRTGDKSGQPNEAQQDAAPNREPAAGSR